MCVHANVECVALVVVERRVAGWDSASGRIGWVADESAGDGSALLGELVGVGEMK